MTLRTALIPSLVLLGLVAACSQPAPAPTEDKAAEPASAASTPPPAATPAATGWASLDGLVGQYPRDSKLLDDSVVVADLKTLLGDKFETLKTNMQTQSPLQREGAVLFTSGNKAHEGGVNAAYVLIDPATKALEVGLWEGGKLTTYKTPGSDLAKPTDIKTMIGNG
ncbi:hypothetical protein [Brevundimonas sp.]|uniref:hypothetical protein n=1 Tax=Brevundimonas sp. TaxID=1871086 RepID=UPI003D6D33EE